MNLHNEIMNIAVDEKELQSRFYEEKWEMVAYKLGHRDARHAAAELSLKAEAQIEELEAVLGKFVNWTTNEAGTKSIGEDVELWELAEKVLENK